MTSTIETFATAASDVAIRSSIAYLRENGLKAEPAALSECLRSHIKMRFEFAMRYAKEAIDCGMMQVAWMKFAATMEQAGIEAAKEAGFPAEMLANA